MTSYVEIEIEESIELDVQQIVEDVMSAVLDMEGCPYEAQVNLLITDNDGIREFNREHRDVDAPTDVLSFPMISFESEADFSVVEEDEAAYFEPESGELLLGDIIISWDKVKEQADKYGHSRKREFAFLTAHSMLHLCGYDHMEAEEARIMEEKQESVLNKLGITRESL
ncbi:MAG: rRNA maturation RNase YbeY [Lachnospiraceae bacterium]|nr:rRNA maturation RNase YbeY [Lachnospiraceae bacterium]